MPGFFIWPRKMVIPEAAKRLSGIQNRRRLWIPRLAALARDDRRKFLSNFNAKIFLRFLIPGPSGGLIVCPS
jgi:hypothetical protein